MKVGDTIYLLEDFIASSKTNDIYPLHKKGKYSIYVIVQSRRFKDRKGDLYRYYNLKIDTETCIIDSNDIHHFISEQEYKHHLRKIKLKKVLNLNLRKSKLDIIYENR